jgi:hypothetical protein
LLDWSEKMVLEPPNSETGAQYIKVGVCVAVCIYRGSNGVRAETVCGIFEAAISDVPHTFVFLRKIILLFAERSEKLSPLAVVRDLFFSP